MKRKVLQLLLAVSLVFTSMPVSAYGAEIENVDTVSSSEVADEETDEVADEVADESIASEGDSSKASYGINSADDVTSVANIFKGANEAESALASLGYHGIRLNAEDIRDKNELSDTVKAMDELEADKDYESDTFIYSADTYEEALEIASCYDAQLVEYQEGIAEAKISFAEEIAFVEENDTVADAVPVDIAGVISMASSTDNNLPAIYPNIIYQLPDMEDIERYSDSAAQAPDMAADESIPGLVGADGGDPMMEAQWFHAAIRDSVAWAAGYTGEGITVAVLDTGVDLNHPDMAANLVPGYNAYTRKEDAQDDNGHGSNCAGIIAGVKNDVGGRGVAYNAKIMPIKVLDYNGSGNSFTISAGLEHAIKKKVDVMNLSLGGFAIGYERKLYQKAVNAGIVVVVSAGNDGTYEGTYGQTYTYPGAYPEVISVAALQSSNPTYGMNFFAGAGGYPVSTRSGWDTYYNKGKTLNGMMNTDMSSSSELTRIAAYDLAEFSNNFDEVDIAAPGVGMLAACYQDNYIMLSGTSQAGPVVAGVVALILQASPDIKKMRGASVSKEVKSLIENNRLGDSYQTTASHGGSPNTANCGAIDAGSTVIAAANSNGLVLVEPEFSGYTKNADKSIVSGEGKTVTITNKNELGVIYYTTDGSDPKTSSTAVSAIGTAAVPIEFSGKQTIKAVIKYQNVYSKVAKLSAKFEAAATSSSVYSSALNVIAGKKTQIVLDFEPEYATAPKVTYTSTNPLFKVDKKGVVKVDKAATVGTSAVITATPANNAELAKDITVTVIAPEAAMKEIILPSEYATKTGFNMALGSYTYDDKSVSRTENINSKLTASGNAVADILVTSSNKKIVAVKNGQLVAKKLGKVKITVAANDGSGLKKTFKLNVVNPVSSILVESDTGFVRQSSDAAPTFAIPIANSGASIKLSATVVGVGGNKPTNAKIEWESSDTSVVQVNKSGIIKPAPKVEAGKIATVTGTAMDGSGKKVVWKVKTYPKLNSLTIKYNNRQTTTQGFIGTTRDIYEYSTGRYGAFNPLPNGDDNWDMYDVVVCANGAEAGASLDTSYLKDFIDAPATYGDMFLFKSTNVRTAYPNDKYYNQIYFGNPGKSMVTLTARDGSKKKIKLDITVR